MEDFLSRGADKILGDAASGHGMAVRTSQGVRVLVISEERLSQADDDVRDAIQDLNDVVLVVARLVTDGDHRTSLDDVMVELGISRDELDAIPDE